MKIVTMTFLVSDEVYENAGNELAWRNYANAATILGEGSEHSSFSVGNY